MADLIDRQAALNAIERLILPQTKGETATEEINRVAWRCAINCAEEMIGHLPTIEAEPTKHGRWIRKESKRCYWFECSECGYPPPLDKFKREWFSEYCPNCGAKMDERREDE